MVSEYLGDDIAQVKNMSNTLKIKHSAIHAIPQSLYWGEMAWSDVNKTLFIGAANGDVIPIISVGIATPDILLPASESLTAGMMVNFYSDGTNVNCRRADASKGIAGQVHGYVTESVAFSETAKIYTRRGSIVDIPGLTAGVRYYLSNSQPGKLTLVPIESSGHILQLVGNSISNNKLEFVAEDAIIRV